MGRAIITDFAQVVFENLKTSVWPISSRLFHTYVVSSLALSIFHNLRSATLCPLLRKRKFWCLSPKSASDPNADSRRGSFRREALGSKFIRGLPMNALAVPCCGGRRLGAK